MSACAQQFLFLPHSVMEEIITKWCTRATQITCQLSCKWLQEVVDRHLLHITAHPIFLFDKENKYENMCNMVFCEASRNLYFYVDEKHGLKRFNIESNEITDLTPIATIDSQRSPFCPLYLPPTSISVDCTEENLFFIKAGGKRVYQLNLQSLKMKQIRRIKRRDAPHICILMEDSYVKIDDYWMSINPIDTKNFSQPRLLKQTTQLHNILDTKSVVVDAKTKTIYSMDLTGTAVIQYDANKEVETLFATSSHTFQLECICFQSTPRTFHFLTNRTVLAKLVIGINNEAIIGAMKIRGLCKPHSMVVDPINDIIYIQDSIGIKCVRPIWRKLIRK